MEQNHSGKHPTREMKIEHEDMKLVTQVSGGSQLGGEGARALRNRGLEAQGNAAVPTGGGIFSVTTG